MRCRDCYNKPEDDQCDPMKCAKNRGVEECFECKKYHCSISPVVNCKIETKIILADDVHGQYCGMSMINLVIEIID